MLETGRPFALRQAIMACRNGGTLSVPGVFGGLIDKVPFGSIMNRSITVRTGQTHVHRYLRPLLEMIQQGKIDPTFIITHRLRLEDAPTAFEVFRKSRTNASKSSCGQTDSEASAKIMDDKNLSGKVIVITGASSGFGKGAALKFAEAGVSVVVSARREQLLQELVDECQARGGRALAVTADVSKEADIRNLAEASVKEFGRIDVWVNNAGSGTMGRFDEIPLDEHVQVIETDLMGTLYGSYYAMKQFKLQGHGTLINMSSVIGKVPAPYFSSYAAAKHGIVGLSATLRQELADDHIDSIHVCTVMPTSMDTPFFEHAGQHTGHEVKPIPPVYDAEKVVDVIVKLATAPEAEVSVGPAGKFFTFAHQLAPGLVESMMRRQTRKSEYEKSEPQAESAGAVKEPSAKGAGVGGGWGKTKT